MCFMKINNGKGNYLCQHIRMSLITLSMVHKPFGGSRPRLLSGFNFQTPSGKVLRRTIKQVADGEQYTVPSTIDDPGSLTDIENAFNSDT
jgi:hypothetical protein